MHEKMKNLCLNYNSDKFWTELDFKILTNEISLFSNFWEIRSGHNFPKNIL